MVLIDWPITAAGPVPSRPQPRSRKPPDDSSERARHGGQGMDGGI